MSLSAPTVIVAGIAWLGVLFAVAVIGERSGERSGLRWKSWWPVVYSLSLAVYCTAWTFYGTTTQAARFGWPVPPDFCRPRLVLFRVFHTLSYSPLRQLE